MGNVTSSIEDPDARGPVYRTLMDVLGLAKELVEALPPDHPKRSELVSRACTVCEVAEDILVRSINKNSIFGESMKLTSKESFKRRTIRHFTLKNGDTVHLAVMTGKARDEWNAIVEAAKVESGGVATDLYCPLLVRCIAKPDGSLIYSNDEAAALAEAADAPLLRELFDLAYELNQMGTSGQDAAKKPSPASGDSGSHSPATSE